MNGFYTPKYNFAVELYNGQWIARVLLPTDTEAKEPDQLAALEMWGAINRAKAHRISS